MCAAFCPRMKPPSKKPATSPTATRSKRKRAMPKSPSSWLGLHSHWPLLPSRSRRRRPDRKMSTAIALRGTTNYFNVAVPAHAYDLILARPEKTSVTLSVLAYQDMEGFVAYGTQPGAVHQSDADASGSKPECRLNWSLAPLQADTQYYYQFHSRLAGAPSFTNSPEYTFHTARPPGSTFTFTMTADAHLDEHTSPDVYLQTLANIRAEQAGFPHRPGQPLHDRQARHARRGGAGNTWRSDITSARSAVPSRSCWRWARMMAKQPI